MQDVAQTIRDALDELRAERDQLDEQIESLEAALEAVEGPAPRARRGRLKKAQTATPAKRKPKWSPEAKEAARKRMKKYWADRKKAEATGGAKPARKKTATKKKATTKKRLSKSQLQAKKAADAAPSAE